MTERVWKLLRRRDCNWSVKPQVIFFHQPMLKWAASWQNQQCGCAPSEDSDQSGHPPSLIRVFAVRMKRAWVLSYRLSAQRILWSDWGYPLSAQRRHWSDWADAQADLSFRWAHTHFVGFVTSRLKLKIVLSIEQLQLKFEPQLTLYGIASVTAQNEPRYEKTCFCGLRPVNAQNGLLSWRD